MVTCRRKDCDNSGAKEEMYRESNGKNSWYICESCREQTMNRRKKNPIIEAPDESKTEGHKKEYGEKKWKHFIRVVKST